VDKTDELKDKLQTQIVNIITTGLENGVMTEDRAKQIAQYVLDQLPDGISYQKLMEIIPTLDDHFHELRDAVIPIMMEYEQKIRAVVEDRISLLLKQNKLDEALEFTKKAIDFDKTLI